MSAQPIATADHAASISTEPEHAPTPSTIVIRWGVSRRAIEWAAPDGTSSILYLELRIDKSTKHQWLLIDPDTGEARLIEPSAPPAPLTITQSERSLHIESDDLCCLINQREGTGHELVYVRTTIFSTLKIPGGRYEPIGCSLGAAGA